MPPSCSMLMVLCRSPHGERGLKYIVIFSPTDLCGRSPHGERGLKSHPMPLRPGSRSRSPHGERGLKYVPKGQLAIRGRSLSSRRAWIEIGQVPAFEETAQSLSSRRAWIEIPTCATSSPACSCRSPHGERGLKFIHMCGAERVDGRSPHGERGLKSQSRGCPCP